MGSVLAVVVAIVLVVVGLGQFLWPALDEIGYLIVRLEPRLARLRDLPGRRILAAARPVLERIGAGVEWNGGAFTAFAVFGFMGGFALFFPPVFRAGGVVCVLAALAMLLGAMAHALGERMDAPPLDVPDGPPRRLPAWIAAGVLVAAWMVLTRPADPGAVAPLAVAGWSALAAALARFGPPPAAWLLRLRGRRPVEFAVFGDLVLIFGVIATAALAVAGLNTLLAAQADAEQNLTIHLVWEAQTRAQAIGGFLKGAGMAIGVGALGAAILLRRAGETGEVDKVFARRKWIGRRLKVTGLVLAALGAFSTGGAMAGASIATADAKRAFQLNTKAKTELEALSRRIERDLAQAAVTEALRPAPAPCGGAACPPADIARVLSNEAARANRLARTARVARTAVPEAWHAAWTPGAGDARALSDGLATPRARRAPVDVAPAARDVSLAAIKNAGIAVAATPPPAPLDPQLKSIVGLGLDIVLQLLPVKLELPMGAEGALAGRLSSQVTDPVKALLTDQVRDTTTAILQACDAPAACRQAARRELEAARRSPAVRTTAGALAKGLPRAFEGLSRTYARARASNADLEAAVVRQTAPALTRSRKSVWTQALSEAAPDELPERRARREDLQKAWETRRQELALEAAGAHKTEPPGGWDRAFAEFLGQNAKWAVLFTAIVQDTPRLRERAGIGSGATRASLGDGFQKLAVAIGGDGAKPRLTSAEIDGAGYRERSLRGRLPRQFDAVTGMPVEVDAQGRQRIGRVAPPSRPPARVARGR